jgi:hypothetical protein
MFLKATAASLVLVAAAGGATTLSDSVLTFKQALGACGAGALGSVSFALGHARVAAAAGIDSDETEPDEYGTLTVVLQDPKSGKSAKVGLDQRKRAVSAKNVQVVERGRVACILPD